MVEKFVEENEWIDFLVKDPKIRSTTSVCLSLNLTKDQVCMCAQSPLPFHDFPGV